MPPTSRPIAPRQASSKGGARRIGRTKEGLNSKLHSVCDGQGRSVALLLIEGQMSAQKGAALLLIVMPPARELLDDRGYDGNRFRASLIERGITPCIPSTRSRKVALPYDKALHRQRFRIENAFGRLNDRRRIATRYDYYAHTFFSAICSAVIVASCL